MSSICPKCKFLLICDALHKDSIIECEDFENRQETNADHIRNMTDEEIAEILHNAGGNWYSEEHWLNWLKQKAEEDG